MQIIGSDVVRTSVAKKHKHKKNKQMKTKHKKKQKKNKQTNKQIPHNKDNGYVSITSDAAAPGQLCTCINLDTWLLLIVIIP